MFLTRIPKITGDMYKQHQFIKFLFDEKILYQETDTDLIVLSEKKIKGYNSQEIDMNLYKKNIEHQFTIRLNPSRRDIRTKKRIPLESRLVNAWIRKKLLEAGIKATYNCVREGIRSCRQKSNIISLTSVFCYGTLVIEDEELFKKALKNGIGTGKRFGFGMFNLFL